MQCIYMWHTAHLIMGPGGMPRKLWYFWHSEIISEDSLRVIWSHLHNFNQWLTLFHEVVNMSSSRRKCNDCAFLVSFFIMYSVVINF